MGHIFDRFGSYIFNNEAQVSNNFVIPLFKEFLGYRDIEILPEQLFPTVNIPRNRKKVINGEEVKIKPDFVVAVNGDNNQIIFSFDSKGPNEKLGNHINQLLAYSISLGTNLVGTTNGKEFRLYYGNDLIFQSINIESLDLQFHELKKILHSDVAHLTYTERIQSLDSNKALGHSEIETANEQRRKIAVRNSDFSAYLNEIVNSAEQVGFPPAILDAFNTKLQQFSPELVYTFQKFETGINLKPNESKSFTQIIREIAQSSLLIIGESGIGKSSLLLHISRQFAEGCLRNDIDTIPVIIKLNQYTNTHRLTELIASLLLSKSASIMESEVITLISQGRLILLLDAYDEVFDTNLINLQQDIENLIDRGAKIVITTRHFRLPQLSNISKYEISPLTTQKISTFAENYLGKSSKDFLNELIRKNLRNVASNTLTLTLLILLYSTDHNLPNSRGKVIDAIVSQLRKWAESKPKRFKNAIPWEIKQGILSELAFVTFVEGDSYTLESIKTEVTIANKIDDLASKHLVTQDLVISDIYDQLADTGLIYILSRGVSFWHRAFQEYLVSFAIAEKIQSGEIQISEIIKQSKWEAILPSAVSRCSYPDPLINELLSINIFTAAKAIIESNIQNDTAYKSTIECLKQKCLSPQRAIRQYSVNLLKQIDGDYVGDKFKELLEITGTDNNINIEHIQKIALVEIARRRLPESREIVYSHLNWKSYSSFEWINEETHAGATVVEALSWFTDEESQQIIIDRWMGNIDFPMRDACKDALIKISSHSSLYPSVITTMLNWFLNQNTNDHKSINETSIGENPKENVDYWGMMEVFIAAHDISSAISLIPVLIFSDDKDQDFQLHCAINILKSFYEPEIIGILIHNIEQNRDNLIICARFLDVLSEMKGKVPIQIFWDFAQEEIPSDAKAYAIRGLEREPFERTKDIVLRALHPPSPEKLIEIRNEYLEKQILNHYSNEEIIALMNEFLNISDLEDNTRILFHELLTTAEDGADFVHKLIHTEIPDNVKWGLYKNSGLLNENLLGKLLIEVSEKLPYEFSLITDPCNYACLQNEVFKLLFRTGNILLLNEIDNRPVYFFNTTAETLFEIVQTEKIFELEPLILSFIEKESYSGREHDQRTIIQAAYVLASLGNLEKARHVIDNMMRFVDFSISASKDRGDWILGDILPGIHLMSPDYAFDIIDKIWTKVKNMNSILLRSKCIEALERIGTREALDRIARIYEEVEGNQQFRLEPERALRAIQFVSPSGRDKWLIDLLQKKVEDRMIPIRAMIMLGMNGNEQAIPIIQDYLSNSKDERIKYYAFWAIHNIYKANNEVWYNGEESQFAPEA